MKRYPYLEMVQVIEKLGILRMREKSRTKSRVKSRTKTHKFT